MESIKDRLETDGHAHVIYVPPGVTGLAQLMDVAVMKPFKDRCRDKYLKFMIEGGVFTTPGQKRRKMAEIVVQAWDEISGDGIRNGFLKAGLIATGPRDARGMFASPEPPSEGILDVDTYR
ncbi:Pogo transposable element with KRAB domain [Phytophthora ramorum]|uniref:Pogo transposable element with KRAB domain n=1 Tax=Phytophthora ramorum TaxID=164328 RepID=UPI00309D381C|nr:Pogo transposable element with KRAB domain [Phytophthora ramorum]